MKGTLVGSTFAPLMTSNLRLEVVIVHIFIQSNKHLGPNRLVHEDAKGIVGACELLDLAVTEQITEAFFQGFQVLTESRPNHDAVRIDRLTVAAIVLASTDGAVKPYLVNIHITFLDLSYYNNT